MTIDTQMILVDEATLRRLLREEIQLTLQPTLDSLAHHGAGHTKNGEDELLTKKEVADLLRVDVRTLRRMVRSGEVPAPVRIGDRTDRWRRTTIESFLKRKEKQALTSGLRRGCVDRP